MNPRPTSSGCTGELTGELGGDLLSGAWRLHASVGLSNPGQCAHPPHMPDHSFPPRPETGRWETVFQACQAACRTSSHSTQHENAFIALRKHCYSDTGVGMRGNGREVQVLGLQGEPVEGRERFAFQSGLPFVVKL